MAARSLRYAWFEDLLGKHNISYIVTAHHKDDLGETMLLNLIKGTGYAGLIGIKPLSGKLLRPLLIFTKSELESYAISKELTWREDSSNSLDKYQRNHLRMHVMPLLKAVNPKVEDAFSRTSEKMSGAKVFIDHQMQLIKKQVVTELYQGQAQISYRVFEYGEASTFILSELLKEYGFDYSKCDKIVKQDKSEPGVSFITDTHHLVCDRNMLVVAPLLAPLTPLHFDRIPDQFQYGSYAFSVERVVWDKYKIPTKMELLLPLKLNTKGITVRTLREGDSMAPYGMGGKRKKVADLLNEAKIPLNLKNYIPIFQIDHEIFWLVGVRSSHYGKVEQGEDAIIIRAVKI
jgi:tRNA(Ile)-lysidine synthase